MIKSEASLIHSRLSRSPGMKVRLLHERGGWGSCGCVALPACVAARVLHLLQLCKLMAEMAEGAVFAGHFEGNWQGQGIWSYGHGQRQGAWKCMAFPENLSCHSPSATQPATSLSLLPSLPSQSKSPATLVQAHADLPWWLCRSC